MSTCRLAEWYSPSDNSTRSRTLKSLPKFILLRWMEILKLEAWPRLSRQVDLHECQWHWTTGFDGRILAGVSTGRKAWRGVSQAITDFSSLHSFRHFVHSGICSKVASDENECNELVVMRKWEKERERKFEFSWCDFLITISVGSLLFNLSS